MTDLRGDAPIWASRTEAERRLTVGDVRARCALLGPHGRRSAAAKVEAPRPAALLAPITELHGEAAIVVTKRPATMLHHQNDWVFPGGRLDAAHDRDTLETAIRETAEELGTPASRIEVIGRLSTHGPIVTGFLIDAYVGLVDIADIAPDPAEVADWAVLPISALTAPGAFRSSSVMPAHHTGPTVAELDPGRPGGRLSFFKIEGEEELWGLQGAVLHELLDWLFGESEAEKPRP